MIIIRDFNVYIFVTLVKHGVLTLVDEIWHYKRDRSYSSSSPPSSSLSSSS